LIPAAVLAPGPLRTTTCLNFPVEVLWTSLSWRIDWQYWNYL